MRESPLSNNYVVIILLYESALIYPISQPPFITHCFTIDLQASIKQKAGSRIIRWTTALLKSAAKMQINHGLFFNKKRRKFASEKIGFAHCHTRMNLLRSCITKFQQNHEQNPHKVMGRVSAHYRGQHQARTIRRLVQTNNVARIWKRATDPECAVAILRRASWKHIYNHSRRNTSQSLW